MMGSKPPDELRAFCSDEYPKVMGSMSLLCGDRALAQDLTQETFVRVCRDWRKVRNHPAPGAWAHRVALNLARSHFRRTKVADRAMIRMGNRADMMRPELQDIAGTSVSNDDLRQALLTLDLKERAVVVLRYYADFSVIDTAEALDVPIGTVKTRTRKALEQLRELGLADLLETSDD